MKTSGIIPSSPSLGPSSVVRIVRFVRTSVIAITFTTVGVIAYCVVKLAYGRKGW